VFSTDGFQYFYFYSVGIRDRHGRLIERLLETARNDVGRGST
jgi:hypothetical protein